MYKVERTASNDRRRSRLTNRKTFDLSTAFQGARSSFFAKEMGEFADMWEQECNKGKKPSAQQVFVGLWQFYSSLLYTKANGGDRASLFVTLTSYQRVFTNLLLLVNFSDLNQPFTTRDNTEYSLRDPTSKACFLVLFLYSIEPPFYFHLNDACRTKNKALLPMLGPFAYAIHQVLLAAEENRGDKM